MCVSSILFLFHSVSHSVPSNMNKFHCEYFSLMEKKLSFWLSNLKSNYSSCLWYVEEGDFIRVFQRAFGVNVEDVECTAGETYYFWPCKLLSCSLPIFTIFSIFFWYLVFFFSKHLVRHFLKEKFVDCFFIQFKSQNCSKASIIRYKNENQECHQNGNLKSLTSRCIRWFARTTARHFPRSRTWHAGRTMQSQMAAAFAVRLQRAHWTTDTWCAQNSQNASNTRYPSNPSFRLKDCEDYRSREKVY